MVAPTAMELDRSASSHPDALTKPGGLDWPRDGPAADDSPSTTGARRPASTACPPPGHGAGPRSSAGGLVVPHVRQMYNWDCGLACVLMVLRAAGARGLDLRTLRAAVGTRSVWTVDLAHLVARFGSGGEPGVSAGAKPPPSPPPLVSAITLTTTWAGANPAYAGEAFYAATLEADRARVGALFARAPAAGVAVQTRRVSAAELGARLAGGRTAVIALVDKGALARGTREDGAAASPPASPPHPHPLFRLGAAWGAAPPPRPPATPDRRPRGGAAAPSPPSPPPTGTDAATVARASPRLAVRRRLSTTSSGGGVSVSTAGPAPLASESASPEPSACTASSVPGALTSTPPLPAGGGAVPGPGRAGGGSYLGHYVVLTGYDRATHAFTLRDPAGGPGSATVHGSTLDAARWAWGTDEDLLLVELTGP